MLKGYPISSILQMKPGMEGSINGRHYLTSKLWRNAELLCLTYRLLTMNSVVSHGFTV
jgi:hypothetical protein